MTMRDNLQKLHFKDVNSISQLLNMATDIQKFNFYTILLGIRKANKANELANHAYDMDHLLDEISKDQADSLIKAKEKEIQDFIRKHQANPLGDKHEV